MSASWKSWGYPLFGLVWILLSWYGIKALTGLHDYLLPAPHRVAIAFGQEWSRLWPAALTTVSGAGAGLLAAAAGGIGLSLLMARFAWLKKSFLPIVLFLQMSPLIATAAIIVILFDVGFQSVVIVTFVICFFPIVASSLEGLGATPKPQLELFRLYGASRTEELFLLRFPYALPWIFNGIQISSTLAVIGAVTGEIFAGTTHRSGGLGFLILIFKSELKTDAIYAATLLCCWIGFGFVFIARWSRLRMGVA